MKPGRTLAPTAAPLGPMDLAGAFTGMAQPASSRERLESELGTFLGAPHVFLFSSGRAALTVLLQALSSLRPNRRVVMPAYTCYSVPASVVRAGLDPVLVDVDPLTLDFDDASLRRALDGDDVLCVLPTHLFGVAADVARLRARCGDRVVIVEDAAQALGVPGPGGRPLGSQGDAAVFSLGRGKHLTCGSGGVAVVRRQDLADACREFHGKLEGPTALDEARLWLEMAAMSMLIDPRLYWLPAGLPFLGLGQSVYGTDFRVGDVASVSVGALRHWKARLTAANAARESTVRALRSAFGVASAWSGPLLRFPVVLPSPECLDRFVAEGKTAGVSRMYPVAVHHIPELRGRFDGSRYPGAELLASNLATVPTHQFVRESDIARLQGIYHRAVSGSVASQEALSAC